MATKPLPSPEVLRQLLRYEPETGKLFWLPRPREMFPSLKTQRSWNARYAESEAFFTTNPSGYKQGRIFHGHYLAHRVIWAMNYDAWPERHIDHANGDGYDNRLSNLRLATPSENARNRKLSSISTTGLKGVSEDGKTGKYRARIKLHGDAQFLGNFDTPEEAHRAYQEASKRLHGRFARTS